MEEERKTEAGSGGKGPTKRQVGVQMTALGLEFSASTLGGMAVGWYADNYFDTGPWLFMVGTFAGLITSFIRIIQLSRQFERARDDGP
jgi:F0F1-type ATP synthase assembly protein I